MMAGLPQITRRRAVGALAVATLALAVPAIVQAATKSEIERDSRAALNQLYSHNSWAKKVGARAKGVMIFPKIIKGGFVVGGSSGEGALLIKDKVSKYMVITSASFGLQAGGQTYGYAIFFMNDKKLNDVMHGETWDVGSDPNVVLIDEGAAKELDTTTMKKEVYAFAFGQKGLMAGITLKGNRTKEIHPKP
jgi:lipid-binding SYLF domain-containing protein